MSDYQNRKKFKKQKSREKAKREKVLKKRINIREEAKVQKILDKMQYGQREIPVPVRQVKDRSWPSITLKVKT